MVPRVREILFSRTFPEQNYHFSEQSIQDLKVICVKRHIIFIQCMINYWIIASFSLLLAVWPIHFYLNFNWQFFLQSKFSSTGTIFIYSIFSSTCFFFTGNIFPGHFLILQNSRTFPGRGKLICYFPGFPGRVGTLN